MELKTIFSNVEPSNKNVIWLTVINGVIIQKIYTANGWQIVPIFPLILYMKSM